LFDLCKDNVRKLFGTPFWRLCLRVGALVHSWGNYEVSHPFRTF
jgi:hypothetical protein